MSYGYMIGSLPVSTVQRLPSYLRVVRDMQQQGRELVSSSRLAGMLGLEAVQVRKDFGFIGITGMPKSGYQVEELVLAMERCLCWNRVRDAVLVGVGHLGTALLGYQGFAAHGLNICAAFDLDPEEFLGRWQKEQEKLARNIIEARKRRDGVQVADSVLEEIVSMTTQLSLDGHRADIVILKAARALAAFKGKDTIGAEDIREAAMLSLVHRARRLPFEEIGAERGKIEQALSGLRIV